MVEKKHLIVGIDPGTTTGVALVGLEGKVLRVSSSRTWNLKDLIHLIIGHGYPLIVATDVSPVPAFVDKVCHLFEAVLYEPNNSLTIEEKRKISKSAELPENYKFRNSHERDALAAAIKALSSYRKKFRWIDRKLDERGLSNISEKIKTLVVTGNSLSDSIEKALSEKGTTKTPETTKISDSNESADKKTRSRRIETSIIKNMEDEILLLKGKLRERELKIKSLGIELEKIQSDGFWDIVRSKEVDSRNKMILELKRSLSRVAADRDRLRNKIDIMPGAEFDRIADKIELMVIIDDLSKRTVGDLVDQHENISRIIMARDCSGAGSTIAHMLRDANIEGLILGSEIPAQAKEGLEACGITPLPMEKLEVLDLGKVALTEKKALERAISRERKRMSRQIRRGATSKFERYVEEYRKKITLQK